MAETKIVGGKMESKESNLPVFKAFDLYDLSEVVVEDSGLKNVINLEPKLVIKSEGRNSWKIEKRKINIIEKFMNKFSVAGHRGKKHKITLGSSTGKYTRNMGIVLEAFKKIEKSTGKNPVQVLVKAIENSAPRDEVTVIEYGGARYPQAVDVAPMRRVNLALRNLVHGAGDRAFGKKKTIVQGLVEEIMMAAENNGESFAVKKKNEAEKAANAAR